MSTHNDIRLLGQNSQNIGAFVIKEGSGVTWKAKTSSRTVSLANGSVTDAQFLMQGKRACLLFVDDKGERVGFGGFRVSDAEAFKASVTAAVGTEVEDDVVQSHGRNWGDMTVEEDDGVMRFSDDRGRKVFDLALADVAQVLVPVKNQVEFQFHVDDTIAASDETVVDLRLYVPPEHELGQSGAGAGAGAGAGDDDDEAPSGPPADILRKAVLEAAGITGVAGKPIAEFLNEDLLKTSMCLTPRGRFSLELYPTFFRMVGKNNEYKVMYRNIQRMFYLPKPNMSSKDTTRYAFVISLQDPLRHGLQRYPHIVLQLMVEPAEVPINLTEKELEAYPGLKPKHKGDLPKVLASIFKLVSKKKVFQPGGYSSHNGQKAIRCSVKSNEGLLFPLDKSLFYIHKPATYIRYADVDVIEFKRFDSSMGTMASRTCDVAVHTKATAGDEAHVIVFGSIERQEVEILARFLAGRPELKGKVMLPQTSGRNTGVELSDGDGDDSESEDSDFDEAAANKGLVSSSEDEDDSDATGAGAGSDDDSDDDGSDDSDDDDDEKAKKSKKRPAADEGAGAGAEDDDDGDAAEPKAKKRAKTGDDD